MKKTFKRLGAVLLAAFMLLSTTICALADEPPAGTSATDKTITLNVSNVNDGDTVSAYKLVWYNNDGNGYEFDTGFKSYIDANNTESGKTAEQYLASLDAASVNKLLEGYATECNKANAQYKLPTASTTMVAANSKASLTLGAGYYLLLTKTNSTNNRVYTPLSAFIQMDGDTLVVHAGDSTFTEQDEYTVAAKSENGPTIDKKTNATKGDGKATWKETAAAGVGDIVRFYVAVTIPAYNNVSALNLTVNDTLTNLKYKEGSAKVYGSEPDAKGANTSKPAIENAIKNSKNVVEQDYITINGDGTQKLKFELDYQKIMGDAAQAKTVYVYYEAIMQKEAVTGANHQGANVATLKYSNAVNPESEYTTNKKETDVYTYHLQVNKKKGGKDEALEGAKFSVYTEAEGGEPLKFVEVTENDTKYYRLAVEGDAEENKVTQIGADFQIRGLDANTYYLDEVKTPKGYYAPAGRFKVVLTSKLNENGTHTGRLDGEKSKLTAVKSEDNNLVFTGSSVDTKISHQFNAGINNFSTPDLPTTGGTGTVLLSIGGVVLMAAGAYLIFFRKKKEN